MRPALLLSLATAGVASAASSRGQLFPFVIGHRGIPSVYPENTVISFQAAVAAGVDGVESDLHFTKDNVLVLIHDDTLERTTNCTGYVWDYTLAQLSSCNANYPSVYGDKYGFVPIPTFESLVKLIAENNIFFVMDLKADGHYASAVCPIVQKYGAESLVTFSAWSQDQIEDAYMNCPGAPRQMLNETAWGAPGMPGDNGNLSMWDLYLQNGVQGFSLELPYLTPDFIKGAHARLLPVNAWTVDTEDDMQKAIDLGVSGILTDDAPQVIAVVNARIQEAMAYKNGGGSGKYSGGAMAGAIIGSVLAGSIVGLIGSLFIFKRGAISWGKAGKTGATAGTKTDGFYVPVAQTPEAMA